MKKKSSGENWRKESPLSLVGNTSLFSVIFKRKLHTLEDF